MTEYLGARISLVSKSDIRYVGTLHEINSTDSTVALENVTSFGTEGRRGNPEDEIEPSTNLYEYIVFRGSDVKDLRIEDVPAVKEVAPLNPPDDPAILQGQSRLPRGQSQRQMSGPPQVQSPPGGPPFAHHPQYPPHFYPPPANWGRGGPPPPGPGGFPMPYGAPPGWYPGPGQGFPPGPFPPAPYGYPPGPPGPFQHGPPPPQQQVPKPSPIGPSGNKQALPVQPTEKPAAALKQIPKAAEPIVSLQNPPTPPVASKPSPKEVAAAVAQVPATTRAVRQNTPGRIIPAVPRIGQPTAVSPEPIVPKQFTAASGLSTNQGDKLTAATQAATAAVATAMAKLTSAAPANGNVLEDLTNKVQQMRTNDRAVRAPAQPGRGPGFRGGVRGGRVGFRGSRATPAVELPGSDFDFDSANAKFNKQDLVKEAIAGSPLNENVPPVSQVNSDVPVGGYNKSTSFFDNISSESKDRLEATSTKAGGREWRGEEQKKNVETFGQGSVDNGYRGGYRGGRGRGRGLGGYRGRANYSGNGQPRGGATSAGQNETFA